MHNKLPWKISDKLNGSVVTDANDRFVCGSWSKPKETYEFMVKACNSYYKMKEALEYIRKESLQQCVINKAVDAISKAKGIQ